MYVQEDMSFLCKLKLTLEKKNSKLLGLFNLEEKKLSGELLITFK